jgi:energy-coupling factor transporter transmembrane protein EcfT
MLLKVRGWWTLLGILLFCILVVIGSLILHQFPLLSSLVFIYWVILMLLWGIPRITAGVKELREARQNGETIPWQQNTKLIQGTGFALPALMEGVNLLSRSWDHSGSSHWPILDLIGTIFGAVFLVALLFLEMILTVGFIRVLTKTQGCQKRERLLL